MTPVGNPQNLYLYGKAGPAQPMVDSYQFNCRFVLDVCNSVYCGNSLDSPCRKVKTVVQSQCAALQFCERYCADGKEKRKQDEPNRDWKIYSKMP